MDTVKQKDITPNTVYNGKVVKKWHIVCNMGQYYCGYWAYLTIVEFTDSSKEWVYSY